MSADTPWWEKLRALMPVAENWAYFDHAAVAPLPRPTMEAVQAWAADAAANGLVNWSRWRSTVEATRAAGAKLLGASQDEIALIRNTTEGVNLVAEGFPWTAGDNVVTLDSEFPSNMFPWLNLAERGVETRRVPTDNEQVDLNRIAAACDDRTRIVSVSWVGYATGWRNDIDAIANIAHQHGALFFLDAIQGLGVFPLDIGRTPIDFLAADGHKWLLGPEGAGLFYIRREHLKTLRPLGVGWNSAADSGSFETLPMQLKQTAARYEGGTYNTAGSVGLGASLNLLQSFGIEDISQRLLQITDQLCNRLRAHGADIASNRNADHRSGIIAFNLPGKDPQQVKRQCRQQGVVVNCRAGRIRVSPHAYTNDEDVNRLLASLL